MYINVKPLTECPVWYWIDSEKNNLNKSPTL